MGFLFLVILLIVLLAVTVYIVQKKQYEKTEYYQQTQNPYICQGKRFWGCSNYPKCKYIENLPNK